MRDTLTQDQIRFYRENGFIAVEHFLDEAELDTWRRCTEEAVAQRLGAPVQYLTNQTDPNTFYARVFTQCLRLADTHAGMHELIFDARLGRMGATLAGIDGIRIWHDQALIKPPYGNPTSFHLDDPYWSFNSRDAISMWMALDDATLANGCLWYLPGTHKTARYENVSIGENMGDIFKVYPEWRSIAPVPVPCPAGSVVWHNGLVAHAAGPNMTTRPRRAMTCAYMPDGCTFNGRRNVLPEAYFKTLKIGDLLNDPVQNPLVWHKNSAECGVRSAE
jgi:ectoine hydroxylase-related dioxygenase (phytanoyl-CoA dioxygenase family)